MKKSALIIFLSVVIITGCNRVASEKNSSNSASNSGSTSTKDYPMMPVSVLHNEIKLLDGKTLKLSQYEGKAIIVNIWGTWCGPCRMEIPELMKLKEEFGDKGVEIVGLSVGSSSDNDITEPEARVKSYAEETKINYDIGFMNMEMRSGLSSLQPIGAVPTTYLFSKDGKIRGIFQGAGPKIVNNMRIAVEKVANE